MEIISRLIRFGAVGFSGMIVDFSLTWLLKEKAGVNRYLANAAGFLTAASSNYLLNRIWTFESHNQHVASEYGRFLLVSVIGLGINSLVLWLCHSRLRINFYLAKLFAIAVATLWNFLANYLYTFGLSF